MMDQTPLEKVISIHADLLKELNKLLPTVEMHVAPYPLLLNAYYHYCFNTFKATGILLAEYYNEQASLLLRSLWECVLTLHYIELNPDDRSKMFAEWSFVEYAKRLKGEERRKYEEMLQPVLDRYRIKPKANAPSGRLCKSWNGLTVKAMAEELGANWPWEYEHYYSFASQFMHGSPGAIMFLGAHTPDELDEIVRRDREYCAVIGLAATELMIRFSRLLSKYSNMNDDEFFAMIERRIGDVKVPSNSACS